MSFPAGLNHRLVSGALLGGGLIAASIWLPSVCLLLLLLLVCAIGTLEFYNMLSAADIPNFRFVGTIAGLVMIASTWLQLRRGPPPDPAQWEIIILFSVTVAILLRLFPQKNNPHPLETVAVTLLGVLYVPFLFNFVTKLLFSWPDNDGRMLVLYMIVVVKCSDIGAYFVGCVFGRHKLIPRISPGKTWEGVMGGLSASIIASVVFCLAMGGDFLVISFSTLDAVFIGLLLGISGIIGDLTESMFKRSSGIKDSSSIIRGMGGLLDVIDSILFAAPALYIYTRFLLL